jgi:hypothetical protein
MPLMEIAMFFVYVRRLFLVASVAVGLIGCGGDSSSDGGAGSPGAPQPFNVALQESGAVATASYDSDNAGIINDGLFDVVEGANVGLYWSGNVNTDNITIALDGSYQVQQVVLYTNAANNTDTTIQYSTDGASFTSIALLGGDCATMAMGSGRIACTFPLARQMSHIRVVVNANAASVRLYELIAMGVPAS